MPLSQPDARDRFSNRTNPKTAPTKVGELRTDLRELYLADTPVCDLAPLQGLANLWRLHLSGTQVSDLSPLKGLTNLEDLFLADTQVSDLSPLQVLSRLGFLELVGDKVTDEELERLQKALPYCKIIR